MDQSKQEKELRKQYNPKDWGDSIYLMRPDGESEKINMKKMKGEKGREAREEQDSGKRDRRLGIRKEARTHIGIAKICEWR